jgi:hypothetical protein
LLIEFSFSVLPHFRWHKMSPPKKKQRPCYQTHPPLRKGRSATANNGAFLDSTAFAQIAAIASACQVLNPQLVKNKSLITDTALLIGTPPTVRFYYNIAETALGTWQKEGTIPTKALDHIEQNYGSVWPTIPFVSRIIRERQRQQQLSEAASVTSSSGAPAAVAGPSSCENATPGCSRTVTTDLGITFPADIFEADNEMWVDLRDDEDLAIDQSSDDEE